MVLIEKTQDGVTTTIDLTEVAEIRDTLEKILGGRKNQQDRRHIQYEFEIMEKVHEMDQEQLVYFARDILGLLFKYADFYQFTLDNPEEHLKHREHYREIEKIFEEDSD